MSPLLAISEVKGQLDSFIFARKKDWRLPGGGFEFQSSSVDILSIKDTAVS